MQRNGNNKDALLKSLPGPGMEASWDNRLIRDLAFIRQHRRYPIRRSTLGPLVMFLIGLSASVYLLFTFLSPMLQRRQPPIVVLIVIGLMAIAGINAAFRHLQFLRFIRVPSPHYGTENGALLLQFLQSEHLAFSRHPEAPEVFQILSKPLSSRGDHREVVIFIADDQGILINSHFTGKGWSLPAGTGHRRDMARMLRNWLDQHRSGPATDIVRKS